MIRKFAAAALLALVPVLTSATTVPMPSGPSAPAPSLTYVFSVRAELDPPVEQGVIDGGRRRFIAIKGGTVQGPRLSGTVMAGGGDWQTIMPGGLVRLDARYFLKAADGTVIEISNPGIRVASAEVTEKLARGELVDPSLYYFRSTPSFHVSGDAYAWMQRAVFVARGIRRPDHVMIDFYIVG